MKRTLSLLLLLSLYIAPTSAKPELDSLLKVLDSKIKNNSVYIELKEAKLEELKIEKRKPEISQEQIYSLNHSLFKEYTSYMSDSAISYLNQNLDIAISLKDQYKLNETFIGMAALFCRLGMYKEASDMLVKVKPKYFAEHQRVDYYVAFMELYLGLGLHSQNNRERDNYWNSATAYCDTIKRISSESSDEYMRIVEKSFRQSNRVEDALKVNDKRLNRIRPNTPAYALVTFHRSLIYRKMGDPENEKKYLILSAISDVNLAIKDNASIPILANIEMKEGNINRAYGYIRFSLDNVKDYNTRLRSSEILNIQTIIDKEYQIRNEKKNRELLAFLVITSVLSVLLIFSVIYVYKQMRKGIVVSKKLKLVNQELNSLNEKLYSMNSELEQRNHEVAEANHIKEEYIGYFLDECSKYIEKLDNYRRMVNKKLRAKQYESLYNITQDNSLKEEESKELFSNFDTMFVNLFPDFVEKFNALLLKDEAIVLKKGEVLNTELRIYALMRLGINDSSKIASFLGYSVNTIYNYRTKMKNKANTSRESFESRVREIGTFM